MSYQRTRIKICGLTRLDDALAGVASDDSKAGTVANASFAGTPKKATVTFTTAFASANYSVELTQELSSTRRFVVAFENKTASGFTISVGANNISGLVGVDWFAKPFRDP